MSSMGGQRLPVDDRPDESCEVRERILRTASELFYAHGARAIGVDLIVEAAGVAKTSLYRHFRSKDELIAAFLEREDLDFWKQWDCVAGRHRSDARAELDAQVRWIAERVGRRNYRGCPQLNAVAEFADGAHPARTVATAHKRRLLERLESIATRLHARRPKELAAQLLVFVNGAFVSSGVMENGAASSTLLGAAHALVAAAGCERDGRDAAPHA